MTTELLWAFMKAVIASKRMLGRKRSVHKHKPVIGASSIGTIEPNQEITADYLFQLNPMALCNGGATKCRAKRTAVDPSVE